MTSTNPTDHNHGHDHDDLTDNLRELRHSLAYKERLAALDQRFSAKWQEWRDDVGAGKAHGLSPVAELKLQALASIAVLSSFHCSVAHQLIDEGEHEAAHNWTLDEGSLKAAFEIVCGIEVTDV